MGFARRPLGGHQGRGLAGLVALAIVVLGSTRAEAQPGGAVTQPKEEPAPPPPPPPPAITLPVLKKDEGTTYPQQAIDDKVKEEVTVTLILEVDATGKVRSASVEKPQGHGFDEAAVEAAKKLEFEP